MEEIIAQPVQPNMSKPATKKVKNWLILLAASVVCLLAIAFVLISQTKKMAPVANNPPSIPSQIKPTPQPLDFSTGIVVSITKNQLTIKSGDQVKTFTLASKINVQKASLAISAAIVTTTNDQTITTSSSKNTNFSTAQLSDIKIGQRVNVLMDPGKTEVKSILIVQ